MGLFDFGEVDADGIDSNEADLMLQKSDRRERGWGRRNVPGGQVVRIQCVVQHPIACASGSNSFT